MAMSAKSGSRQAWRQSNRKASGCALATGMMSLDAPRSRTSSEERSANASPRASSEGPQHGSVERRLGVEQAVEDQAVTPGFGGDVVHRRAVVPAAQEGGGGGLDDLGPARLSRQSLRVRH